MAENSPTNPFKPEPQETPVFKATSNSQLSLLEEVRGAIAELGGWCGRNPLGVVLLATIVGTLVYFYGFVHPFMQGSKSTLVWAKEGWNPEGNQEYGAMVPVIALALVLYHWSQLRLAPKRGSAWGLACVVVGMMVFVLAVRCLQPRMALVSIPFILFGSVMFVWGKATARIILFPCAFLIFMVPMGAIEQATFRLQFVVTGMVQVLSHFIGMGVRADGTTLMATDGSFNFEIAEGCSGIRSLMAMVMITAAYVHLTQNRLWKKLTIFGASVVFAIIGNTGRVFSILLVAKFYDPKFAAGKYHESSGWIFFPIAVGAMLFFDWLVNSDSVVNYSKGPKKPPVDPPSCQEDSKGSDTGTKAKEGKPVQYDY